LIPRNRLRHPFEERLLDIKQNANPKPFGWYPFDSIANITHLEALLPRGLESVVDLAGTEPVADIGTGDGDMAFLLESLGCNVTAIDWPGTNANEMKGLTLLRQELGSSIAVREIEIDQQFRLDGDRFGLVLALGLLYHLKNPYYFLEKLAVHARYGLFSTCLLAGDKTSAPVAYLASEKEFHNDPTNFWFFSERGILRLLDRCGWDVLATKIIRDGKEDRFFCLAESRVAKTKPTIRLLDGWHDLENRAWRWTGREFGAVIDNVAGATRLEFRFEIVPALLMSGNALVLEATVDGVQLSSETYRAQGKHVYSQPIASAPKSCEVRIRLSHTFPESYPNPPDGDRDLGVIVRLPPETIIDNDCGLRLAGAFPG
jgi:tRNA (mo5U34)-methyltransferase